jgi:hypothetical protein
VRDASGVRKQATAKTEADPCGMTKKGQATATADGESVYIPPIAKSAMDGAPGRLWFAWRRTGNDDSAGNGNNKNSNGN